MLNKGVAALLLAASLAASAQNVQHLATTNEGGMPGLPTVTGVAVLSNGVSVTWDGPAGYYQLFEKPSLQSSRYQALGLDNNLVRHATVSKTLSNAVFRVIGPAPAYAGERVCVECHSPVLNTVTHTLHAQAFSKARFHADGGQTNALCLRCHTVGFGVPTGFISLAKTPQLAGVQCENCHGPAAYHAANPDDPTLVPRVEVAATVCGGCHRDERHPTFEEWQSSAHSEVISKLNQPARIDHCGRCHSGTVRLALIEGQPLPAGDAEMGIECITCHSPHQTNAYPAQLRYPVASTNNYFMPTNGAFATYYKTGINVCGQCHNDRGESWKNNDSEPHHSLQYNMLLGTVGIGFPTLPAYQPGSHALRITNQCVGCHMQRTNFVSDVRPANTGHSFEVYKYDLCLNCHVSLETVDFLVTFVTGAVSNEVQQVVTDLDFWAANTTNQAAQALYAKYGNLAWEYTSPGGLSSGGPGPNATEQKLIPENIRKARFNLYVVQNDGSFGVHNPEYVSELISEAEDLIAEELDP